MNELKNSLGTMISERVARRALIIIALAALVIGLAAAFTGHDGPARWIWAAGTILVVPVLIPQPAPGRSLAGGARVAWDLRKIEPLSKALQHSV
jgi:hypothetical protein